MRNGSMGVIIKALKANSIDEPLCLIDFQGSIVEVTQSDLAENVVLAYAITVHKSQGSQWERVIMPIMPGIRLLERSMLYTALTRSIKQVTLVGEQSVARNAIVTLAADSRVVNLDKLVKQALKNIESIPKPLPSSLESPGV